MPGPAPFTDRTSHESGVVDTFLQWTSGASGAVPSTLTRSMGVKSVVHGATGVYVVTLKSPWKNSPLEFTQAIMQASYSASGACFVRVTADASSNSTTPTITLLVVNAAGAAVEPTTGDVIRVSFKLQSQTSGY